MIPGSCRQPVSGPHSLTGRHNVIKHGLEPYYQRDNPSMAFRIEYDYGTVKKKGGEGVTVQTDSQSAKEQGAKKRVKTEMRMRTVE